MEKRFYTCIELDRAACKAWESFEWDFSIIQPLICMEQQGVFNKPIFSGWKCDWSHPDYESPETTFSTLTNVEVGDPPKFVAQWFYYKKVTDSDDELPMQFIVNLPDMGVTIGRGIERFNIGAERVTLETPKSEVGRLAVEGHKKLMETVQGYERRDAWRASNKLKLVI